MSLDIVLAFALGVFVALLVALPVALRLRRLLREARGSCEQLERRADSLQAGWREEQEQTAGLGHALAGAETLAETWKRERDQHASACSVQTRKKETWKIRCASVVTQHNALVGKYQGLARQFKDLQLQARERLSLKRAQIANLTEEKEQFANQLQAVEFLLRATEARRDAALQEGKVLRQQDHQRAGEVLALSRQVKEVEAQERADREQAEAMLARVSELEDSLHGQRQEVDFLRRERQALAERFGDLETEWFDLQFKFEAACLERKVLADDLNLSRAEILELQEQLSRPAGEPPIPAPTPWPAEADPVATEPPVLPDRPIKLPGWVRLAPINLGLDFGTHSTKLILQTRNQSKPLVVFLDDEIPGYPPFASPSLVCLRGGRLYFGSKALQVDGGTLFRSLKVDLLPPRKEWVQAEYPRHTTPDFLVAAYLSWLLQRVKEGLGPEQASKTSLNVAAPMDHFENETMKERYLRVVHAAWQATFTSARTLVTQGVELAPLYDRFTSFLGLEPPPIEERRFEVLPETLAPLVSLLQDPKSPAGLHLMVDMGAGTTELSVSKMSEPGSERRLTCYMDKSVILGGNDFEANGSDEESLKDQLLKPMLQVWYRGYQKEFGGVPAARELWKHLRVVLSGGGLRRAGLREAIERSPPLKQVFLCEPTSYDVGWHHPTGLDFGEVASVTDSRVADSLAFLAVAHGLSLERQKWPAFHPPKQVTAFAREAREDNPLDRSYIHSDGG